MPKKSKLLKKDEGKMLQEKPALSQEEVNSLEQMIDNDEEDKKIDFSQIKDFLTEKRRDVSSSPSLEKINAPQRNTVRLEGNFADTITPTNNNSREDEDDPLKYIPKEGRANQPKYIQYEGEIIASPMSKAEFERLPQKDSFVKKEIRFEGSMQSRTPELTTFEKYTPVGRLDKDLTVKKNPFEKKEIKYTPEKY
jgi:hypothetical protein